MQAQLISPRPARIWAVCQEAGLPIMHHCCGDIQAIIGDLADMGLTILHPLQAMLPWRTIKAW